MPKRPAFFLFTQDFIEQQKSRGIKYKTLPDAMEAASPYWKALDERAKDDYKAMSKGSREFSTDANIKSIEVPIFELIKGNAKFENSEQEINSEIQSLSEMNLATLKNLNFCLVHLNYYCKTDVSYLPAEFVVAKFSLQHGITDYYQTIINPGALPAGTSHTCQMHAERFHKIPLNYEGGLSNIYDIYDKLQEFTKGTDKWTSILFTPKENESLNHNYKAMTNFLDDISVGSDKIAEIYPLHELLYVLKNACSKQLIQNKDVAEEMLCNNPYLKERGICCKFHDFVDNGSYCSLGNVISWIYTICNQCCPDIGVKLLPVSHKPPSKGQKVINLLTSNSAPNAKSDIDDSVDNLAADVGNINFEDSYDNFPALGPSCQSTLPVSTSAASSTNRKRRVRKRGPVKKPADVI